MGAYAHLGDIKFFSHITAVMLYVELLASG